MFVGCENTPTSLHGNEEEVFVLHLQFVYYKDVAN